MKVTRHVAAALLAVATLAVAAGAGPAAVASAGQTSTAGGTSAAEFSAADRATMGRGAASVRAAVGRGLGLGETAREAAAGAARDVADRARIAALTRALDARPGTFAVAVVNNRTGEVYRYRSTWRFQTASVMKLDILAAVLLAAQDAGRGLTATERSLASRMIRASDNAAASALWWQVGGHDGLTRVNARLGLTRTVVGYDAWWGTTTTTVTDQIRMVDVITGRGGPLSRASAAYAVSLMTTVNADQDWGVGAAAHSGERVALKNGWFPGPTSLSEWTINSVGRITDRNTDATIAVLSQANRSMASGVGLVEAVTRLTRHHLRW